MNVELLKGDITTVAVDAIVNAANTSLLGGGGVDGAIHRAGGKEILEQCEVIRRKQGGCRVGEAVITNAGKLPARFVIHAVGPVWNEGKNNEEELLCSAYTNSLELAVKNNVATISFPNISTGTYNFPKEKAATIAIRSVAHFLQQTTTLRKVLFVCYDQTNYEIYLNLLKE